MDSLSSSIFDFNKTSAGSQLTERQENYHVGSVINDQYLVKQVMTGGALGKTYRCLLLLSGQDSVLKSVDAGAFLEPDRQNRLLTEIQNWMKLPHCANLVNISNTFYDTNVQTLFLCMPYIHGHPDYGLQLDEWFDNYRFSEFDIFYTALCVCRAFKDCLAKTGKVPVHGDIKPSNLLVEYVGQRFTNEPYLSCNIRLADCGATGYTPRYFPMEYRERELKPDAASDVFALFTLLQEMEKHTISSYSMNCPMHGLIEMMLTGQQWKIYDLAVVYDDFLMMMMELQYRAKADYLLFHPLDDRATEIWRRVQDIQAQMQTMRKSEIELKEIETLWDEANRNHYTLNGFPLTHLIDRYYFVCASLCGEYELSEAILTRFETNHMALPMEEQNKINGCYSKSFPDDFKILHAQNSANMGQIDKAIRLYHDVFLETCLCFSWLGKYVEIFFPSFFGNAVEEGLYIKEKLTRFLNASKNRLPYDLIVYVKCCLGTVCGYLGDYEQGIALLDECVAAYPHNLEYLFQYGYILMLDGDISKARYPLNMLYYHCCEIEKRNSSESGLTPYHSQSTAYYKMWAALMLGDYPTALAEFDRFAQRLTFYSHREVQSKADFESHLNSSYAVYLEYLNNRDKLTSLDVVYNYHNQYQYWEKFLANKTSHVGYILRRGEFQVFMNFHTLFCDLLTQAEMWDELIAVCENMLTLRRSSSNILKYMGRAYAMKGDKEKAIGLYTESANLASIEYPKYPANGDDSIPAKEIKAELRAEMQTLGLDSSVIR